MAIPSNIKALFFNSKHTYSACEEGRNTPSYRCWDKLKVRCYDTKYHLTKPKNIGCTIHEDWYDYQDFAHWYVENHRDGWDLVADVIDPTSTVFGPSTSCFIPRSITTLLNHYPNDTYPTGVAFCNKVVKPTIRLDYKNQYLGCFPNTPEGIQEAYDVHVRAKLAKTKDLISRDGVNEDLGKRIMIKMNHHLREEAIKFNLRYDHEE